MMKQEDLEEDIVIIDVNGSQFSCSRKKLSDCSPYFNAMFNGHFIETNEKSVTIQETNDIGFRNILNIIDDGSYFINYNELLDTLQAACMLQFDNVREHCIKRLTDDLKMEYCLQIWNTSEELDLHPLCEKAKCKALIEFDTLKYGDSILLLDIKQLHSYLSSTLLHCDSEMDVFETGMKWWYEYSKKLTLEVRSEIESKYLVTILSCVDFSAVTHAEIREMSIYPDIKTNSHVLETLDTFSNLASVGPLINVPRRKQLVPCVISSELIWAPDQNKKQKINETVKAPNITCFDYSKKCMRNVLDSGSHFREHCTGLLKGFKVMPYKANLLLYGGEYNYGTSNFNKSIWVYHTFRDEWELLSVMPKERRHFETCLIGDRLFIIGGTGKFRVKLDYDMFYYNIRKDTWTKKIHLPLDLYDMKCCEYNRNLLGFPTQLNQRCAYLFFPRTKVWQKLKISGNVEFLDKVTGRFIVFSVGDTVYIKGNYFLEMYLEGTNLYVKQCIETEPLYGDTVGHCLIGEHLWIFEKHDCSTFNRILTLKKFNYTNNQTDLCVQINDDMDKYWHIRTGCFPFFHYSLAKDSKCISAFKLSD